MNSLTPPPDCCSVAPHWGAWIEITRAGLSINHGRTSHPTGVRGLKYRPRPTTGPSLSSHPTGVRGLKYDHDGHACHTNAVAPHWGAWIEIFVCDRGHVVAVASHPTGVRGLK